jgi:transcriptional regulator with XRE-family HTH domain
MAEAPPGFADWLISTGRALGYTTNTALAKAIGVPQPTVSRWKSGSKPSVEHLVKISELFGVELKLLLVLAGYMKGDPQDVQPTAPLTSAERIILKSEVDEPLKDLLLWFWSARQAEELHRLGVILEGATSAVDPEHNYTPATKFETWVVNMCRRSLTSCGSGERRSPVKRATTSGCLKRADPTSSTRPKRPMRLCRLV